MRIGIVTSGGDCPGLNAVIRGAVLHGQESYGYSFTGFRGAGAARPSAMRSR